MDTAADRAASAEAPGSDGAIAVLTGVEVQVGRSVVLREVDLRLSPGEVLGVCGANGSGKTTLLQLLATLRRPAGGAALVLGADLSAAVPGEVRREICLVGHHPALYPSLSLLENLSFFARLAGRSTQEAEQALAAVGLSRAAHRRGDECSMGMNRRADLARAMVVGPRLLLLDEAHAGLDPGAAEVVNRLVDQTTRRGGACVVVSHEPHRLAGLATRSLTMWQGRLSGERVPL